MLWPRNSFSGTVSALRPLLVGVAALLLPGTVQGQAELSSVRANIEEWWESAANKAPGNWGIAIADEKGELIWSIAPNEPLIPASTVKLFTTGFARSVLGGNATRPTRIMGSGWIAPETGTWVGPWALELNGDVTLGRVNAEGPSLQDLARQLRASGIRRLTGPLVLRSVEGEANATWPEVWASRHRGRTFAPLVGPVTVNENVVSFTVKPGSAAGRKVILTRTAPEGISSLIRITATTYSGRRNRLRFIAQPDGTFLISGTLGTRAGAQTYNAPSTKPEKVVRAVWANALAQAGIEWQEEGFTMPKSDAPMAVLAEVTSPSLDSVASEVNRRSLNIGAELLLQWAAGRGPDAPRALTEHVRAIAGADAPVHLVDGSGLSYQDRVAPATFVHYLAQFPHTPAGRNFSQLLPANGSGTLKRLRQGLPELGVVRAKTGTLNEVATVVGYLGRPDGVLLVSLMYNGKRTWAARQQQWALFRTLGADGVAIPSLSDSLATDDVQLGGDERELLSRQ